MTVTFNDRAIGLMEQANELKDHVDFLKGQKQFIKDNFSKLDEDRDSNIHRIDMKVTDLNKRRQKLMKKAYDLVDSPLEIMKYLTPVI